MTETIKNNDRYTVGWICALASEFTAAVAFLDEDHGVPEYLSHNDTNTYRLGKMNRHNVVITVMPQGSYGTTEAAVSAQNMLHSFPNVRIGLMVGIGGGAPSADNDIRLGDIVVSVPAHGTGGVLQYDFGKTIQRQKFKLTGHLNEPPRLLKTAIQGLQSEYKLNGHGLVSAIEEVLRKWPRLRREHKRPEPSTDKLFKASVVHRNPHANCQGICDVDPNSLVRRSARTGQDDDPMIHYGLIASANQMMKDAEVRDRLIASNGVLCFEMEAAGLMNHFPCLVVRGICNYSDSHENKEWRGYAAMTAAAYTKDLLGQIPPVSVEEAENIEKILSDGRMAASRIEEGIVLLDSKIDKKENRELLDWAAPEDYGRQHTDYFRRSQEGTGRRLLNSSEFKN